MEKRNADKGDSRRQRRRRNAPRPRRSADPEDQNNDEEKHDIGERKPKSPYLNQPSKPRRQQRLTKNKYLKDGLIVATEEPSTHPQGEDSQKKSPIPHRHDSLFMPLSLLDSREEHDAHKQKESTSDKKKNKLLDAERKKEAELKSFFDGVQKRPPGRKPNNNSSIKIPKKKKRQRVLDPLSHRMQTVTEKMQLELKATAAKERALFSKLEMDGKLAIEALPVEFLRELKLRDFIVQRGAKSITRIFNRVIHAHTSQALTQWRRYTEWKTAEVHREQLTRFAQDKGFRAITRIHRRLCLGVLAKAFECWSLLCFHEPRRLERLAASVQLQRLIRGHLHRRRVATLLEAIRVHQQDSAVRVLQRTFRAYAARNLYKRLKVKKQRQQAALRIQLFFRMVVAKEIVRRRLQQVLIQREREIAATRIQCLARRRSAQKTTAQKRMKKKRFDASVVLQCAYRSMVARTRAKQLRQHVLSDALAVLQSAVESAEREVAAIKIQEAYGRYREIAIHQVAAISAIEMVMRAEEEIAALAIQNRYREFQIHRMVRKMTRDVDYLVLRSTIVLQTATRGMLARKRLMQLRIEERARRIAAVKLQAARRGHVDRRKTEKRKTELRHLVTTLEQARWKQLRRRLGRRVLHRFASSQTNLVSTVFRAWAGLAERTREIREIEKLTIAARQFDNNLQAKAFRSWIAFCYSSVENRDKLRMALNRLRQRRLSMHFAYWMDIIYQKHRRKQRLVVVFMTCVDLATHNSSRQKAHVSLAFGLEYSHILHHAWKALMTFWTQRKELLRSVVNWYETRWHVRAPRLVFNDWKLWVEEQKHKRRQFAIADAHFPRAQQDRVLRKLGMHAAMCMYKKSQLEKAEQLHNHFRERLTFKRYKEFILHRRHREEQCRQAADLYARLLLMRTVRGWVHYWQIRREKNAKKQCADNHYERVLQRKCLREFFLVTHAEVLERRRLAATRIQVQVRIRFAKLERFKRFKKQQYVQEKQHARELEALKKVYVQERQLRKVSDGASLAELVNENAAHSNRLLGVLFVAPWVSKRVYYNFETILCLACGDLADIACHFVRADAQDIGVDHCILAGVRDFPWVGFYWRGKSIHAEQPANGFWNRVLEPLQQFMTDLPVAKYTAEDPECFVKGDPFEADRVAQFVHHVKSSVQEMPKALHDASRRIQKLFRVQKGNRIVRVWRILVKEVVRKHLREQQEARWAGIDFEKFQIQEHHPRKKNWVEDKNKNDEFHFNHKTLECVWEQPVPDAEKPVDLLVVFGTGHREFVKGRFSRGSSFQSIVDYLCEIRQTQPQHLRISLRTDCVWFQGSIIHAKYNQDTQARIGAGCIVEYRAGGEASAWTQFRVKKVYPDESVDLVQIEDVKGKVAIEEEELSKQQQDRQESQERQKEEEKEQIDGQDLAAAVVEPAVPETGPGAEKGEIESELESKNDEDVIIEAVPRYEIRQVAFNMKVDGAKTLVDLGFKTFSVLDVEEGGDDDFGDGTSHEEKEDPTIERYGLLCSICLATRAAQLCRQCEKLYCDYCCIVVHQVQVEELHIPSLHKREIYVPSLDEYDKYILQRKLARHTFVPIDPKPLSETLRQETEYLEKKKKKQHNPQHAENELGGEAVAVDSFFESLKVCGYCSIRIPEMTCTACQEVFCKLCFDHFHAYGKRRTHRATSKEEVDSDLGLCFGMELVHQHKWKSREILAQEQAAREEDERIRAADRKAAEDILKEAFKKHDKDGSGELDAQELGNFLRYEICEPISDEEVQRAIKEMDDNGNGLIEYEELLEWFVNYSKREGRDTAKMRLLRANLLAKKRARLIRDQIGSMLPREKLINTRKFLEEQAQKWLDRRPPVPGFANVRQLQLSDFEQKLYLFERYVRREFNIACTLTTEEGPFWEHIEAVEKAKAEEAKGKRKAGAVKTTAEGTAPGQQAFEPLPEEYKQRVKLAFQTIFMPAYNKGKLSKVYYHDGLEFTHKEEPYVQIWDDKKDKFVFKNLFTGQVVELNPILRDLHEEEITTAFRRFDQDQSGFLDAKELKRFLEGELCIKITKKKLQQALVEMDRDGDEQITCDELLAWFCRGIDLGEHDVSFELRARRKLRALREAGVSKTTSKLGGASTKVGQSLTRQTAIGFQSFKQFGKSALHRKLVNDGWDSGAVEKALSRVRHLEGDEEKERQALIHLQKYSQKQK